MVFYHTSTNIKMLKNIMLDFERSGVTPHEYMETYLNKCPVFTEDTKLTWISNCFLGIEKHYEFLKEIVTSMSGEISENDQYYGMIFLHAIIFQTTPTHKASLYKSLFNISKPLLSAFTQFLSNNEILTHISRIAKTTYDTDYITNKIINPIVIWQPYISEMADQYAEYVNILENRKLKPPTVPLHLNVLNRKSKEATLQATIPDAPPNSFSNKDILRKQLTKNEIDKRLKAIHDKNKEKAINLLYEIKNKDIAHTKKDDKSFKETSVENYENFEKCIPKPRKFLMNNKLPPVKETKTTLKRLNKRLKAVEEEEIDFLRKIIECKDVKKIEELQKYAQLEEKRERLLEIEKKHVLGQLSYEEAILAKNKVCEQNKKKYEDFLKEKQQWAQEIEKWKKDKITAIKKLAENVSMSELNVACAKIAIINKNKELALKCRDENQSMLAEAMKEKQEELERRINMVKEIKVLAMIAKKARVPKIIDFTETSGCGCLCEMSLAELHEKLAAMKLCISEELETKRALIKEQKTKDRQELDDVKSAFDTYATEKAIIRSQNRIKHCVHVQPTKEILDLKKSLEEKRKLRMKITNERIFKANVEFEEYIRGKEK